MRHTSKRIFACVAAAAALVAGCGSSAPSGPGSAEAQEASYFPSRSPLIVAVATDPQSPGIRGLDALIQRFPLAALGEAALRSKLTAAGIDYDADVRPLLGNPALIGASSASLANLRRQMLGVWITKDGGKLSALLKKIPGLHQTGSRDGATLYQAGSTVLAQQNATLLIAGDPALLASALALHASGKGGAAIPSSVSPGALVSFFGSLDSVLAQPSAAKARRVPWVAALKGYSGSLSASSAGVTLSYHLDASGQSLSAAEVPLAQATGTPQLAGNGPITLSILDPAHIVTWALAVQQTTSPGSYARFRARQAKVRAKTGVDLTSLIQLLNGDLIISSNTRSTLARVGVSDPSTAAADLAKLARAPQAVFSRPTLVRSLGNGFYRLSTSKLTVIIGVAGDQLALGESPRSAATVPAGAVAAFAAAPTTPAAGAQGPVAFRVSLSGLLNLGLLKRAGPAAAPILRMLGDVTGWTSASASALDGTASLALR